MEENVPYGGDKGMKYVRWVIQNLEKNIEDLNIRGRTEQVRILERDLIQMKQLYDLLRYSGN